MSATTRKKAVERYLKKGTIKKLCLPTWTRFPIFAGGKQYLTDTISIVELTQPVEGLPEASDDYTKEMLARLSQPGSHFIKILIPNHFLIDRTILKPLTKEIIDGFKQASKSGAFKYQLVEFAYDPKRTLALLDILGNKDILYTENKTPGALYLESPYGRASLMRMLE